MSFFFPPEGKVWQVSENDFFPNSGFPYAFLSSPDKKVLLPFGPVSLFHLFFLSFSRLSLLRTGRVSRKVTFVL